MGVHGVRVGGDILPPSTTYDRRLYVEWPEFNRTIARMADWVRALSNASPTSAPSAVYGQPRGGLPLAVALSHALGIPLCTELSKRPTRLVFVDDIYDSGSTWNAWVNKHELPTLSLVWFARQGVLIPSAVQYCEDVARGIWVVFPWENRNAHASQK